MGTGQLLGCVVAKRKRGKRIENTYHSSVPDDASHLPTSSV